MRTRNSIQTLQKRVFGHFVRRTNRVSICTLPEVKNSSILELFSFLYKGKKDVFTKFFKRSNTKKGLILSHGGNMDKIARFKALLQLEQRILQEYGANLPVSLLRLVTGLYILQEEEILSSENRYYCWSEGHQETLVGLQRQWIFHGGENAFWKKHSRVAQWIEQNYREEVFLAYLALQGALFLEQEHRYFFEIDTKMRVRFQGARIEDHGARFISPYLRLRYKGKFGGIVP